MAHPREVIRAGRQKPDVCRCAAFKKLHISTTVSTDSLQKSQRPAEVNTVLAIAGGDSRIEITKLTLRK